jgi:hypothetical protein
MIAAITEADWEAAKQAGPVSRQKKDAIFELACRVAQVAERARASEGASVADDARSEKRKLLRFGLDLIAQGADAERLDLAYKHSPITMDLDAGTRLELAAVRAGLGAIATGEHPHFVLRRMTAFLGYEYFDKASAWMEGRLGKRRKKNQSLLVPGDLPDLVRSLALDPRSLERTLRAAGWELAVAAMAGCAQESVDLAAEFYGKRGAAAFEDDAEYLRARLAGDEIGQAQNAFMDVVKNLEAGGELALGGEDEFSSDPAFVGELTRAVMALDDKSLRGVFRDGDSRILALAMQGLEPRAHERILELLPKRLIRRLLDAVDDAAILPRREVLVAGKTLAHAVLAQAALTKTAPPEVLDAFERIRDWVEEGKVAGV